MVTLFFPTSSMNKIKFESVNNIEIGPLVGRDIVKIKFI